MLFMQTDRGHGWLLAWTKLGVLITWYWKVANAGGQSSYNCETKEENPFTNYRKSQSNSKHA